MTLQQLQSEYSDWHKSLYGFRPRPSAGDWNSVAYLEAQLDALAVDAPRVEAQEQARENAAVARFEALVSTTIGAGARTRATAIKWLQDAQGDDYCMADVGYFEYLHGLPYGYIAKSAS